MATPEPEGIKDEPLDIPETVATTESMPKARYKSWRKKYRKMRLIFEERMTEAKQLFIAEQKALNIARRMGEEVDQVLDILIDVNNDPRTPAHLRWDQGGPWRPDVDSTAAGRSLADLEQRVTHTPAALPGKDVLPIDLLDLEGGADLPPGYLTTEQEEEYLAALDASIAALPPVDLPLPDAEALQPVVPARVKALPTERDFALKHPCSVYNWLKKYHPHINDQQKTEKADSEKGDDARIKGLNGKGKFQKSALSKPDLQFDDINDESGVDLALEVPGSGSAKGKKKKDDDAYRPKGGSSKASKRKREKDDGGEGKGGKKHRKSGLSVGEEAY